MNKDLLDDSFGRYREVPLALARRGHDVQGLCLSYEHRNDDRGVDTDSRSNAKVRWESVNLGRTKVIGVIRYLSSVRRAVRTFRPDVIWAGSDTIFGPFALFAANGRASTRVILDFYDDYETFSSARVPGVAWLYRRACRAVDGITSFSQAMTNKLRGPLGRGRPTLTLLTGVDTAVFRPLNKTDCRRHLRLPESSTLVGMAGGLSGRQGMGALIRAVPRLSDLGVHVVLAGVGADTMNLPDHPALHYLGELPPASVPTLLNALDVGIVLAREGEAGRIGFPHKAYEMLACGLPLVAADVGAMREVLANCPDCLFDPNSPSDVSRAIEFQIKHRVQSDEVPLNWDTVARELEGFFVELSSS